MIEIPYALFIILILFSIPLALFLLLVLIASIVVFISDKIEEHEIKKQP